MVDFHLAFHYYFANNFIFAIKRKINSEIIIQKSHYLIFDEFEAHTNII